MNTDAPRPPADRPVGDAPAPRTAGWAHSSHFDTDAWGIAEWREHAGLVEAEVARLTRLHGQLTGVLAEVERSRAREREINAELRATVERLKRELYEVQLAAAGGEDVPGSATTVTAKDVERWTKENSQTIRDQHDTIEALTALARKMLAEIEAANSDAARGLRSRLATITGEAGSTSKDAKDG